jgi:aspartate ammonia-lyase
MAKRLFCGSIGISKIMSNKTRLESDSMGTIEVPAEHYWGAHPAIPNPLFNWRRSNAQAN